MYEALRELGPSSRMTASCAHARIMVCVANLLCCFEPQCWVLVVDVRRAPSAVKLVSAVKQAGSLVARELACIMPVPPNDSMTQSHIHTCTCPCTHILYKKNNP